MQEKPREFTGWVNTSDSSLVSGWAVAGQQPSPVTIRVNGRDIAQVAPTISRVDVAATGLPEKCGFFYKFEQPLSERDELAVLFPDGTELDWVCVNFARGNAATFPLPPPVFMGKVGGADPEIFDKVGAHVFRMVRDKCKAKPEDRVLDIGCGCGRVAIYFTNYLNAAGAYDGFDIDKPMIEWCEKNITSRQANFRFHHAQLTNSFYEEPGGDAASYVFPFKDKNFDIVFAASVFTHLVPASAQQYLNEISRVMQPGGRALLSFYVINDEFRRQRAGGAALGQNFQHDHGDYSVVDEEHPEYAIAFEEALLGKMIRNAGLRLEELSFGSWRKPGGWSFQDWALITKP